VPFIAGFTELQFAEPEIIYTTLMLYLNSKP